MVYTQGVLRVCRIKTWIANINTNNESNTMVMSMIKLVVQNDITIMVKEMIERQLLRMVLQILILTIEKKIERLNVIWKNSIDIYWCALIWKIVAKIAEIRVLLVMGNEKQVNINYSN